MPIRPLNPNHIRSTELGAAHEDHTHAHADTTGQTADDHHDELHAGAHGDGGADEITITEAQISDLDHYDSTDFDTDHAAETHVHTHELDELDATGIADGLVLTADGADGAVWEAGGAGGGGPHTILHEDHTDVDDTDTAIHGDVLTFFDPPALGEEPLIRAVGTMAEGTAAIAPGLPAGTAVGDLLIMGIEHAYNTTMTATGWTAVPGGRQIASDRTTLTLLYRIATGTDATTTNDSGDHQVAQITGFTVGSFDAINPFNAIAGGANLPGGGFDTTISCPTVTTTVDNCLITAWVAHGEDGTAGSWANSSLVSIAEYADATTLLGDDGTVAMAAGILATAGASGATTGTITGAISSRATITLAIAPAGESAGQWIADQTFRGDRYDFEGFVNLSRTTLTIASGVVTATGSFHLIDTEAAGATDDLVTINGAADGDLLILRSFASTRDTTVKDGTGNIFLASGDYVLATTRNILVLIAVGTSWFEISRN